MRYDNDTFICIDIKNPKQIGSAAYDRYELYKKATSIKDAKKLGATAGDIRFDVGKGYIRVTNTNDLTSFNSLVMELIKENKKLAKRVDELELYVKKQNKQTNYIEYLNQFKPKYTFYDFMENFNITEEQFEYLYNESLLETINIIFTDNYDQNNNVIKCFEKKPGEFYIYGSGQWLIDKEYENTYKLFLIIYNSLRKYFVEWEQKCYDDGSERVMLLYCEINQKIYTDVKPVFIKFKNFIFNKYKISLSSSC
tara:strand:+ start:704 stop:1462 length:759 start_codon:yes stop_codon:yes gene_type:complete